MFSIDVLKDLVKEVYAELGGGFSERVYQNALEVLLRKNQFHYDSERVQPVQFQGHVVGHVRADVVVEQGVVMELKALKALPANTHTLAAKYVRTFQPSTVLVVNFPPQGTEPEIVSIFLNKEEE